MFLSSFFRNRDSGILSTDILHKYEDDRKQPRELRPCQGPPSLQAYMSSFSLIQQNVDISVCIYIYIYIYTHYTILSVGAPRGPPGRRLDYTRLVSHSAPTWSSRCLFTACHCNRYAQEHECMLGQLVFGSSWSCDCCGSYFVHSVKQRKESRVLCDYLDSAFTGTGNRHSCIQAD